MECHECGATISDKAADCPHCGASVRDLSGGDEPDEATHDDGSGGAGGTATDDTDRGREEPVPGGTEEGDSDRREPTVPGWDDASGESPESGVTDPADADSTDEADDAASTNRDQGVESTEPETRTGTETETEARTGTETEPEAEANTETETGWEAAGPPPEEQETRVGDESVGGPGGDDATETGWEAAGPPPDEQGGETGLDSDVGDQETAIGDQETAVGDDEPTVGGASDFGGQETGVGGGSGFGEETDTTGREPGIPDQTGETGAVGADTGTERDSARGSESAGGETVDLAEGVTELPFLTGPIAGLVTAAVLAVLSVVVAALVEGTGLDTASLGGLVVLDLHFATGSHVTPGLLGRFDVADPPASSLGLLYLLPPLFCYTAAKFVAAYNVEETTPLPLAGLAGALIAVGYAPVVVVALVLAPGDPQWEVSLLAGILLAGIAYPVFFGFLGGLAAGAFSSSERRVGTLYGVVSFFLLAIGAVVVTVVALEPGDLGLLPQIHASLFTIVAANGFSLGGPNTGALVFLGYPLVAGVVFAAGFLRAWNANDVVEPLRGAAKGLSPVATYFLLLGVVATVLPVLADPWVIRELGFTTGEATLVQDLVDRNLETIGRYVFAVFVGTLVYAVFLGGLGGTVAGAVRYGLSDDS
jgi:hypothetical protein